jgi:hypothetical protein
MKYVIMLILAALTQVQTGRAQISQGRFLQESSALMTDAMGQPFYPQQKYSWEGKVFFPEEYSLATITTANGKSYKNIKAKLNLFDNSLLFLDSAQREFVVTLPVAKVEFENFFAQKNNVFIKPLNDTGTAFYQVLDSGKITLLKKIFLTYKDQMGFGSTSITRIFEQKFSYFTYANGLLKALDRSKSAVLELMAGKSAKVDAYIEAEKLKMRKEEDLVKVFRFYNGL